MRSLFLRYIALDLINNVFYHTVDAIRNNVRTFMDNIMLDPMKIIDRLCVRLESGHLVIDEIGYLPIKAENAKLFFQLIDLRYEKRSTIFTTNVNFRAWGEVFRESKLVNTIIDRILHHATVVLIVGESYRLKNHIDRPAVPKRDAASRFRPVASLILAGKVVRTLERLP